MKKLLYLIANCLIQSDSVQDVDTNKAIGNLITVVTEEGIYEITITKVK